jgi:hypothetical protein
VSRVSKLFLTNSPVLVLTEVVPPSILGKRPYLEDRVLDPNPKVLANRANRAAWGVLESEGDSAVQEVAYLEGIDASEVGEVGELSEATEPQRSCPDELELHKLPSRVQVVGEFQLRYRRLRRQEYVGINGHVGPALRICNAARENPISSFM